MAVHFMFAASKQYDSVPVVGDYISLGKLKDEIATLKFRWALEKRKMKEAFDFRVYDAKTREEIVGAHSRVRKNSQVLVKRVPAFVVSQQTQQLAAQSCGAQKISEPRENVVDDGFGEDVYSTLCVSSERNSNEKSVSSNLTAIKSSEEVKKIDAVSAKKIVRPKVVEDRKVVRAATKNLVSSERVVKSSLESTEVLCNVEIPLELTCLLCHDIMKDPVLIPCCCNSFCRNCVTLALVEQQKCPKCASSKCRDSDLLPNRHVNNMIHGFLKSNGSASNVVSSNGSCSSQLLASSISSENGREMTPRKNTSDHKSSVPNSHSGSQIMAPGSDVFGKRKPLCISLSDAKKVKMGSLS